MPLAPPASGSGHDALLALIRGAGIGGLKKVDKSQLDKPSALLQEARGEKPAAAAAPSGGAPGQPALLQDALALALNKRKTTMAGDDDDDDDEW